MRDALAPRAECGSWALVEVLRAVGNLTGAFLMNAAPLSPLAGQEPT